MKYEQTSFPARGYVPQIRGYCRVSHSRQFEQGNSIQDQEARIRQYVQLRQSDPYDVELQKAQLTKLYIEPRAQSAFRRELSKRPAGRELWADLKPGDHIVADKFDRMFRSMSDFCESERYFTRLGVRIHFVNLMGLSVDTGTSGGRLMMQFYGMLAENESFRISERVSLARSSLRARGKHCGGGVPFFCSVVGCRPGKKVGAGGKLVFKPWALQAMEMVVAAKDSGLGYIAIGKQGVYDLFKANGIDPGADDPMRVRRMRHLYCFYKAWTRAGKPDINTIKISTMIREYESELRYARQNQVDTTPDPGEVCGGVLPQPDTTDDVPPDDSGDSGWSPPVLPG